MSRGSFTRSAARATSSALRALSRIPIRWKLAGGSALLTLVILCGFADRRRRADGAADPRRLRAGRQARPPTSLRDSTSVAAQRDVDATECKITFRPNLTAFVGGDGAARLSRWSAVLPSGSGASAPSRGSPRTLDGPPVAAHDGGPRLPRREPRRSSVRRPAAARAPVRAAEELDRGDRPARAAVPRRRRDRRRRASRCSPG